MYTQKFRDVHQRVIHVEGEGGHLTESLGQEFAKDHQSSPSCVGLAHLCAPPVRKDLNEDICEDTWTFNRTLVPLGWCIFSVWGHCLFPYIHPTYKSQFCSGLGQRYVLEGEVGDRIMKVHRKMWCRVRHSLFQLRKEERGPSWNPKWRWDLLPILSEFQVIRMRGKSHLTDGQEHKCLRMPRREKRWSKGVPGEGGPSMAERETPLPGSSLLPHTEPLPYPGELSEEHAECSGVNVWGWEEAGQAERTCEKIDPVTAQVALR